VRWKNNRETRWSRRPAIAVAVAATKPMETVADPGLGSQGHFWPRDAIRRLRRSLYTPPPHLSAPRLGEMDETTRRVSVMADFKTHITTSSVIGAGYGAAGYLLLDAPLPTCVLSAGLCGLAGMLPDLDSDTGVPVRETMSLAAAVVPMLMIDRFESLGWSHETIVLAGGILYFGVRFGVASLVKRYTVHRGMWHSLPAAAIFGLLAYLICSCDDMTLRLFKTFAVVLGFMVHLILDELWSIDLKRFRVKKSFGTAIKLWGNKRWGNFSVYAKLALLVLLVFGDPMMMERFDVREHGIPHVARDVFGGSPAEPNPSDAPASTVDGAEDRNVVSETTGKPFNPWDALPTIQR